MKRKNEKDHDNRKSPGSAEVFKKQRKERNQARPKQVFDPATKTYSRPA